MLWIAFVHPLNTHAYLEATTMRGRSAAPAALLAALLVGSSGATVALAAEKGAAQNGAAQAGPVGTLAASPATEAAMAANAPDHDEPADHQWNQAAVVPITLTGATASAGGAGVTVNGGQVTITAPGTYQLSGTLTDGQVAVDTDGAGIVRLILSGASITSSTSSAINVVDADEAMVVLAAGTTNRLVDATRYVYPDAETDEPDAALFSDADLTIAGTGTLTVRGNQFDGIASKDGLVIAAGTITVDAADQGIRGRDYVVLDGGSVTVTARAGDGVRSNEDGDAALGYVSITGGTLNVTSAGDGVDAATDIVVSGGDTTVRSGGGSGVSPGEESTKGLKADVSVVIGDGRLTVDASDDGINTNSLVTIDGGTITVATGDDAIKGETEVNISRTANVTVTRSFEAIEALRVVISGGTVNVTARDDAINSVEEGLDEFANSPNASTRISGGTVIVNSTIDGIDSNGAVAFSGGTTVISGPASGSPGEGAIDANGATTFTGGTVIGAGSTVMAVFTAPPTNAQGWLAPRFSSGQSANTIVHVVSGGQVLVSYRSPKNFRELVFSSNRITNGQSYEIYTGGSVSGTPVGGLYPAGSISGATRVLAVTAGQYTGGLIGGFPPPPPPPPTGGPTTPPPPPTGGPTTPPPPPGGRTCTATYAVISQWPGGFQGEVRVTAGATAITGWRVTWTFANGQTVNQAWNATLTASGSAVTATNVSHNGTVAASASTTFGFIGSWNGGNAVPALACTAS
jgi:hypothetical protein